MAVHPSLPWHPKALVIAEQCLLEPRRRRCSDSDRKISGTPESESKHIRGVVVGFEEIFREAEVWVRTVLLNAWTLYQCGLIVLGFLFSTFAAKRIEPVFEARARKIKETRTYYALLLPSLDACVGSS